MKAPDSIVRIEPNTRSGSNFNPSFTTQSFKFSTTSPVARGRYENGALRDHIWRGRKAKNPLLTAMLRHKSLYGREMAALTRRTRGTNAKPFVIKSCLLDALSKARLRVTRPRRQSAEGGERLPHSEFAGPPTHFCHNSLSVSV
jgi:hypothetical protein